MRIKLKSIEAIPPELLTCGGTYPAARIGAAEVVGADAPLFRGEDGRSSKLPSGAGRHRASKSTGNFCSYKTSPEYLHEAILLLEVCMNLLRLKRYQIYFSFALREAGIITFDVHMQSEHSRCH